MLRRRSTLRILFTLSFGVIVTLMAAKSLPAGYTAPVTKTYVQIDGIDFGPFDEIAGIDEFTINGAPLGERRYGKITLSRGFVTDPSLYLWAKNRMSRKSGLKDIHLITEDELGNISSRQILHLCQPLSWTVEAANPSLGGFNETIDIAVQTISYQ